MPIVRRLLIVVSVSFVVPIRFAASDDVLSLHLISVQQYKDEWLGGGGVVLWTDL